MPGMDSAAGLTTGDSMGAHITCTLYTAIVDADPAPGNSGSSALYGSGGPRYGLGMSPRSNGSENKMNGLHGPKHKRGEIDRECKLRV